MTCPAVPGSPTKRFQVQILMAVCIYVFYASDLWCVLSRILGKNSVQTNCPTLCRRPNNTRCLDPIIRTLWSSFHPPMSRYHPPFRGHNASCLTNALLARFPAPIPLLCYNNPTQKSFCYLLGVGPVLPLPKCRSRLNAPFRLPLISRVAWH